MGFMNKILSVLTYTRCSTSHHDQRPEVQLSELRKYCNDKGWAISHEIVDHGYSGGTDARPGLKQLMSLVRNKEVDVVIVLKLDRLFRSLRHLVLTLDEFHERGITFIAIRDNVDYSTPSGKLLTQILASMAEWEKDILRERTLLGLEYARSIGKKLGRPKIRDDEAIQRLSAQGISQRQIAKQLHISKTAVQRCLAGHKSPKNTVPKVLVT